MHLPSTAPAASSLFRRSRARTVIRVVSVMFCLWHGVSPVYRFPSAEPFRGGQLFNPYSRSVTPWWKVNLHAHSRAWGGLTNGRSTAEETVSRYRAMGYDVAAVSNY